MTKIKYCGRDCIYFESNYHMDGNEEWEDVSCRLGHNQIHDMIAECEDYDDGGVKE